MKSAEPPEQTGPTEPEAPFLASTGELSERGSALHGDDLDHEPDCWLRDSPAALARCTCGARKRRAQAGLRRSKPLSPSPSSSSPPKGKVQTLKPGRGMAASQAQRDKIKHLGYCLHCEVSIHHRALDPAHLAARAATAYSEGGCDHPDCVIPLCRTCHDAFDDGRLDILAQLRPYHAPDRWRAEIIHSLDHYELNVLGWLLRVTGSYHVPARDEAEEVMGQRLVLAAEIGARGVFDE